MHKKVIITLSDPAKNLNLPNLMHILLCIHGVNIILYLKDFVSNYQ